MECEKVEMKVEHFMDLVKDKELVDAELNELLDILFENARLNYDDSDLCFDIDNDIKKYLIRKERERYLSKLKELQLKEFQKEKSK